MSVTLHSHSRGRRLILRQPTTPSGGTVVRLATATVLASMALTAATGTAAAAPAAPLPAFTDGHAGPGDMLLNAAEAGSIVGTRGLSETKSGFHLDDSITVRPASCVAAYSPGQAASYADTEPEDVAWKVHRTPRSVGEYQVVTEVVVQLPSKKQALAHLSATADAWAGCKGRTVASDEGNSWTIGPAMVNDERTMVTLSQTSAKGNTCESAIAAYRNMFIDVMVCSSARSEGLGAAVVRAIADKGSAQSV